MSLRCLSTFLTILLMMATILDQARSARKVSPTTQAYVNARYEAAKSLIELNPQVYIFTVFRHFREHFANVGIGTRAQSHLPILLQDLDLMPAAYRKPFATVDRVELHTLHHVWQLHNTNQPDGDYFDSVVVIPVEMRELFVRHRLELPVQSLPYRQLLDQMLTTVNEYPVASDQRKKILNHAKIKKCRFLAIFWLTVMDRYIRTLEGRGIRIEINTFQRTTLQFPGGRAERVVVEPNQVRRAPNGGLNPGQVAGPMVNVNRPGTSGVGTNPKRRASSPAAAGALSSGATKRKATNQGPSQGDDKRSRGGSMDRSMNGASKSKFQVEQVHHHKRVKSAQDSAFY